MSTLNPLDFLVLALATWRIAYLVTHEHGPYNIVEAFRSRFPLGGLTSCLYCASAWAAAGVYVLWLTPLQPVVIVAAVSGLALMLASYSGANHT